MPKDEKSRFGLWWEHSPPPPPPQDWQSAAAYLRARDPNPPALVPFAVGTDPITDEAGGRVGTPPIPALSERCTHLTDCPYCYGRFKAELERMRELRPPEQS